MGDINNDGFDEALLVTDDSLVCWDMKANAALWATKIDDGNHNASVSCFRKPIITDIDQNGTLEVIIFIVDNSGGISSLDIYNQSGTRLARKEFLDGCFAPAMAVGDFSTGDAGLEILLVARETGASSSEDVKLYLLDKDLTTLDAALLCKWYQDPGAAAQTVNVNSALAVGNCYGSASTLEVVMSKGKAGWSGTGVLDTLMVCQVETGTGNIVDNSGVAECAIYPVSFKTWTIFGSSPALADIDDDGADDIVFATDDSLYVLKMDTQNSISAMVATGFGHKPANRLDGNQTTPQVIVTKNGSINRVYVNHQGDGCIWAFDIGLYGYVWYADLVSGYPLKTLGRVSQACAITDLEGDDTLDLTAVDDAGYVYAWKLGPGSVCQQPWAEQFGNNWNTSNTGYKDAGVVGYVDEDWKVDRVGPFTWLETESGNSTTPSGTAVIIRDNGVLKTQQAGGRNSHFVGPTTINSHDYTVSGTMKFDDASAEFGVNFYSKWPTSSAKYTLMRMSTGAVHLYCYWGAATGWDMGTVSYPSIDTIVADLTGTWYHYEIKVDDTDDEIAVKWWKDSDTIPDNPGLTVAFDGYTLPYGVVGVNTHGGSGYRYWGPIIVTTNTPEEGANIAYEDFTEDTIVDIAPYVPGNWSPDYGKILFSGGYDTTGFVFNEADTALVYKHKPGCQYPVSCNVSPYTNLEWNNYAFSGKIEKPAEAVYDSIWVGVDVYSSGGSQYRAKFRNDTMIVSGGGIAETVVVTGNQFDNGDVLHYKVTAETYKDSVTYLTIDIGINSTTLTTVYSTTDVTTDILTKGLAAVYLDMDGRENSPVTDAIKFDAIRVKKVQ